MDKQTKFEDIFKIKVWEITLRELLLLQSIYASKTVDDVEVIVKCQPDPKVFFKIFLELGVKSMIPYLSFSTKSIEEVLHEKNK